MKISRFSEEKIIYALKQVESGTELTPFIRTVCIINV